MKRMYACQSTSWTGFIYVSFNFMWLVSILMPSNRIYSAIYQSVYAFEWCWHIELITNGWMRRQFECESFCWSWVDGEFYAPFRLQTQSNLHRFRHGFVFLSLSLCFTQSLERYHRVLHSMFCTVCCTSILNRILHVTHILKYIHEKTNAMNHEHRNANDDLNCENIVLKVCVRILWNCI